MRDGQAQALRDCLGLKASDLERCQPVVAWLRQFDVSDRPTAMDLLMRLRMVPDAQFSLWLRSAVESLPRENLGIYAIRKTPRDLPFWDENDRPIQRPATSQGSEDRVFQLISQLTRAHRGSWFDNPAIETLRTNRVHRIVLLDDSIGSGDRVATFCKKFFSHRSIKSWWSMGKIDVHIISMFRSTASREAIIESFPGSDHHTLKRPRFEKVHFLSDWIYDSKEYWPRWGHDATRLADLCRTYGTRQGLPARFLVGYGSSFSPYFFEHGVPNNMPSILFHESESWHPLFPSRTVPIDLVACITNQGTTTFQTTPPLEGAGVIAEQMIEALRLVKTGVRNRQSLAMRMNCHASHVGALLNMAQQAGLMTAARRLTVAGLNFLLRARPAAEGRSRALNFDLYVPRSWRTDQATIQPPTGDPFGGLPVADSGRLSSPDGEFRSDSLERTDARAASPPSGVEPSVPTRTRARLDTPGPTD